MKMQTGIRVDSELWGAYRLICGREKLRPSRPVEEFLRLVVDSDSVLSLMRGAAKVRVEGSEAYARVLLDWYSHGKSWVNVLGQEDSLPVEALLLDVLKVVADPVLRGQIQDTLIAKQRLAYEEESKKG